MVREVVHGRAALRVLLFTHRVSKWRRSVESDGRRSYAHPKMMGPGKTWTWEILRFQSLDR
jgi:hypothetical protein